jgi:dephospho-CoA kinase
MKVVGLTGTIAAGKSLVKESLIRKFKCDYVSLSTLIMEETLKKKRIPVDKFNKQNLGNELRQRYGNDALAKTAWNFMQKKKEVLIIDGIRNPGEAEFLRRTNGRDFIFIAVDAPREMRWMRVVKRNKSTDPKTLEEFEKVDDRDQGINEPDYGQQVRKCIEMADYVLVNDGSYEDFMKKCDDVIAKI